MLKCISAHEAQNILQQGNALCIDIRDKLSFREGHIPAATWLDQTTLPSFIEQTQTDTPILVYCYHGISSQSVARFLMQKGFTDVASIDGGFDGWQSLGFEVVA